MLFYSSCKVMFNNRVFFDRQWKLYLEAHHLIPMNPPQLIQIRMLHRSHLFLFQSFSYSDLRFLYPFRTTASSARSPNIITASIAIAAFFQPSIPTSTCRKYCSLTGRQLTNPQEILALMSKRKKKHV